MFEARIMALADVYDALISERPYKKRTKPAASLQKDAEVSSIPILQTSSLKA